MTPALKMILATLTALLAGLGLLVLLPNLIASEVFTADPPRGHQAVGIVLLFFAAILGGLLLLAATATAAGTGGLNWAGRTPGVSFVIVAALAVGIGAGTVGAVIHWSEPGDWPVLPVCLVCGLVGPVLLAGVLVFSVFSPTSFQSPAARYGWLAALGVCALVGYGISGVWTFKAVQQSAANARRSYEAETAREAEWERKRLRSPIQAATEDFADMGDASPLWCVVTYLPTSDEPAYQQFVIARCLKVPDFENELARTITSSYAVYRHPCVDLVRLAPDSAVTPGWRENVGRSIDVTAEELRQQPNWLTDTSNNPKPLEHLRSLIAAAKRVAPHGELNDRLENLRGAVADQPLSEAREAAVRAIDASGPLSP